MLEVKDVCKSYKKKIVLANLSFQIADGNILFLLGNNGCGKSTTLKLMLDHNLIDSGEITLDGNYLSNKDIAYLPEKRCLYQDETVYEQIKLIAQLNNCINVDFKVSQIIDHFKLSEYKNTLINRLSKGNQQKVMLACCFIKDSRIYLLDEPFTALDKDNSYLLVKKLIELKQENKIIILTSHNYQYLDKIVDRYIYLDKAKIGFDLTSSDLENENRRIIEVSSDVEINNKYLSLFENDGLINRYLCNNKYQSKQIMRYLLTLNNCHAAIKHLNIKDYIRLYEQTNNV